MLDLLTIPLKRVETMTLPGDFFGVKTQRTKHLLCSPREVIFYYNYEMFKGCNFATEPW